MRLSPKAGARISGNIFTNPRICRELNPIYTLQGLILALKYSRFYNLGCVIVSSCYLLILFHVRIYDLFFNG